MINLLYILAIIPLYILAKGFYEIYISKEKQELKTKPVIKYGFPLLITLLLAPSFV